MFRCEQNVHNVLNNASKQTRNWNLTSSRFAVELSMIQVFLRLYQQLLVIGQCFVRTKHDTSCTIHMVMMSISCHSLHNLLWVFMYAYLNFFLTHKGLETHGWLISHVATEALVIKSQAISIRNADWAFPVLEQLHTKCYIYSKQN